jgi:hypothetical protein
LRSYPLEQLLSMLLTVFGTLLFVKLWIHLSRLLFICLQFFDIICLVYMFGVFVKTTHSSTFSWEHTKQW